MKHILISFIGLMAVAFCVFAQVPNSYNDPIIRDNKVYVATIQKVISNASTFVYRIQPQERVYLGGYLYSTSTSAFGDVWLHPSYEANGGTNLPTLSNYYNFTNAPAATINVVNQNEGGLRVNEIISVTQITQAVALNTTNTIAFPCRTVVQDQVFLLPQYLQNTRTYMLVLSNSTGTTNNYVLKLVFWRP